MTEWPRRLFTSEESRNLEQLGWRFDSLPGKDPRNIDDWEWHLLDKDKKVIAIRGDQRWKDDVYRVTGVVL